MFNKNLIGSSLHLHTYIIALADFLGKIAFSQNTQSFILDQRGFLMYAEFNYKITSKNEKTVGLLYVWNVVSNKSREEIWTNSEKRKKFSTLT